jgi:hypothetical protein
MAGKSQGLVPEARIEIFPSSAVRITEVDLFLLKTQRDGHWYRIAKIAVDPKGIGSSLSRGTERPRVGVSHFGQLI